RPPWSLRSALAAAAPGRAHKSASVDSNGNPPRRRSSTTGQRVVWRSPALLVHIPPPADQCLRMLVEIVGQRTYRSCSPGELVNRLLQVAIWRGSGAAHQFARRLGGTINVIGGVTQMIDRLVHALER